MRYRWPLKWNTLQDICPFSHHKLCLPNKSLDENAWNLIQYQILKYNSDPVTDLSLISLIKKNKYSSRGDRCSQFDGLSWFLVLHRFFYVLCWIKAGLQREKQGSLICHTCCLNGEQRITHGTAKNDHGLFQITSIKSVLQLTTNLLILIIEKT